MKDIWEYLKSADKPICLYGTGNGADKIIEQLNLNGIKISGIFASDGFVRDRVFHGFKVTSYETLKEKFVDMIILVCFGSSRKEVIENVKRLSFEQELYAPDVPVYGKTVFNKNYYLKNKDSFDYIRDKLSDNQSKKVFDSIIKYKISGNVKYLFDCETNEDETNNLLNIEKCNSFLDLGAYRGDTLIKFADAVKGNYKFITAVEPDIKTYKKLIENTKTYLNINYENACIHSFDGTVPFSMNGGRNSTLENGNCEIRAVTIDTLSKENPFDLIKFDVEGNELNGIIGGINTIKNSKPKMVIATYHRSEDLISIPNEVLKIRSDYKIYLRHNPSVLSWDTNYIFV